MVHPDTKTSAVRSLDRLEDLTPPPKASAMPPSGPPSFGYQPALDGVRAIAVVLVLLFHGGVPLLRAGYLGVSVFFTLSGYLITSLLLTEHERTDHIAVGAFYGRRMRRLLPASTLCVALVLGARAFGAFDRVEGLRADVFGALLQCFNWVTLAGGGSYGDLFVGGTSPLEHYWSLAVEEQFYWLWPVLMMLVLRRWHRRVGTVVLVLLVMTSLGAVITAHRFGPNAAYWATPARLPEILVGAALACWLADGHTVRVTAHRLAGPALVAIVGVAMWWPSGSGPAYAGALPAYALLSAVLVYSLQVPGPVRTALSAPPLVAVGRVSYGLYLFHWPVFVLLRERWWDLTEPSRLFAAIAITSAITVLSYRFLEQPIRHWSPTVRRTALTAALSTVTVLVTSIFLAPKVTPFTVDPDLAQAVAMAPIAVEPITTPLLVSAASPIDDDETDIDLGAPPSRPVRILLVGDSTMNAVTIGVQLWANEHPEHARVNGVWSPGLVFLRDGEIVDKRLRDFAEASVPVVDNAVAALVPLLKPDVVVLMTTLSDAADRRWSDDGGEVIGPTDDQYRTRLEDAYESTLDAFLAAGAPHVVWVVPPVPLAVPLDPAPVVPERYRVQQEVIRDVVARTGDRVDLIELETWLDNSNHIGRDFRRDGLHIQEEQSAELADRYLGPWIVRRATTVG
jgi:peptidoglycan/LPS O-acetylase OafA/YrhL